MATYGSVAGVEGLVPEVGTLSSSTTPTTAEVTTWLGQGYAMINRAITNAGYTAPIASSAALYDELVGLENLYAAAYTLRARGIDAPSGETESRSETWLKDFYARLKDIARSNLSVMGATLLPSTTQHRRRRIRTLQMRKVDGFTRRQQSADYEAHGAEYTSDDPPTE